MRIPIRKNNLCSIKAWLDDNRAFFLMVYLSLKQIHGPRIRQAKEKC